EALGAFVAEAFARPLDTSRPLWELIVVEGLSDNRVAVLNKVHHAMVDGISSVDIGTLLFDAEPEPPAPRPVAPWRPRPGPSERELASHDLDGLRRTITTNPVLLPFRHPR